MILFNSSIKICYHCYLDKTVIDKNENSLLSKRNICICGIHPFPNNNLDYSKLQDLEVDNFRCDENGGELFKSRKHSGKRRLCSLQASYPFPTVF